MFVCVVYMLSDVSGPAWTTIYVENIKNKNPVLVWFWELQNQVQSSAGSSNNISFYVVITKALILKKSFGSVVLPCCLCCHLYLKNNNNIFFSARTEEKMKQKEKNKLFRCNIIIKHLISGFLSSEKDMVFSPASFYGSPEWTNTLCQFYSSPKPPQKNSQYNFNSKPKSIWTNRTFRSCQWRYI